MKFLAYGWSSRRSLPAVRDQVVAALAEARHTGWDGLLAAQRAYLDDFWERADVEIDGDAELQQAVRFALFHTLQAGARAEQRAIAAKGLTGPGYDGHTFWDTERFVLPVLTYTAPRAAADALRWRHSTLDLARERAAPARPGRAPRSRGGRSAARSAPATGRPARPPSTSARDIADAVVALPARDRRRGLRARGRPRAARRDRAALALARPPRPAGRASASTASPGRTSTARSPTTTSTPTCSRSGTCSPPPTRSRAIPAAQPRSAPTSRRRRPGATRRRTWSSRGTTTLGVHPQSEGFTDHQVLGLPSTRRRTQYPLLLHYPYFDLYRKQVVKQADLVLALHARGDAFTDEEKARDFAYYEALTVRDSSLSACTQAVIAAEVGHLELAYDYFARGRAAWTCTTSQHNTRDGLHIASLAGAWIAAVAGFGGMRDHDGKLTFAPRLPRSAAAAQLPPRLPRPPAAGRR